MSIELTRQDHDYWGLTPAQRVSHWGRLGTYHARRSRYWAERAAREATRATRLAILVVGMAAVGLVMTVLT